MTKTQKERDEERDTEILGTRVSLNKMFLAAKSR
jgi:hypothetical protein